MQVARFAVSHTLFALHVPGVPVLSFGHAEPPCVHDTVHAATWFGPSGMQIAAGVSGQLCSSLQGSYAEPMHRFAASGPCGVSPLHAASSGMSKKARRMPHRNSVGVSSSAERSMAYIEVFKSWAESIRPDVDALKALLESTKADAHSRKLAGAALAYLMLAAWTSSQPDWNEGIGVIDDVMVLRVASQLTQGHERAVPTSAEIALERMANEADHIAKFLGAAIYDKLKSYTAKLVDTPVRGRTPQQLIDDAAARKALYADIEDEIKRTVPIVVNDPVDAELRLKAYLTHKLQ